MLSLDVKPKCFQSSTTIKRMAVHCSSTYYMYVRTFHSDNIGLILYCISKIVEQVNVGIK